MRNLTCHVKFCHFVFIDYIVELLSSHKNTSEYFFFYLSFPSSSRALTSHSLPQRNYSALCFHLRETTRDRQTGRGFQLGRHWLSWLSGHMEITKCAHGVCLREHFPQREGPSGRWGEQMKRRRDTIKPLSQTLNETETPQYNWLGRLVKHTVCNSVLK